jgi:hypothetical protein
VREWFSPAAAAVVACPNISYENSPMWRVDL